MRECAIALARRLLEKRNKQETKVTVYKTVFRPILVYVSERWMLNATIRSKRQAIHMKYLRRVKRITDETGREMTYS